MEFIRYIFGDLFHFLGAVIIVQTVCTGAASIISAWRGNPVCECEEDDDE